MNELAQFFTKEPFSALLMSSINFSNPKLVVDLGIGDGSLTSAAQKKWKDATFYGVDVDRERVANLTATHSNVSLFNVNSLDTNLSKKINIKVGSVDIAVCNPPYLNLDKNPEYSELLKLASLDRSTKLKNYTTDLLFIAQNLSLLKSGGVLGIILPAGLICGHHFELFRQDLLENHSIENVIELQAKIFKKTEAKTFILILRKGRDQNQTVLLSKADKSGRIIGSIEVLKGNLHRRMDYDFHFSVNQSSTKGYPLRKFAICIKRGTMTNADLKKLNVPYFHTTDFKDFKEEFLSKNHLYDDTIRNPVLALDGDILLGRVGKTCHTQILIIRSGSIIISDCVYRIRVPKHYQQEIYKYLSSSIGIQSLKTIKHGVCAQVISKKDLENLKIDISIEHLDKNT